MKPVTVTEKKFRELIGNRSLRLMSIAHYLLEDKTAREDLIRPVLGEMLSQSTQLEELLDSYGARNNSKWCRFRAATAAIKLFSDVSYELRHIEHSLPVYRLLEIEKDFAKATRNAMDFTCGILLGACSKILQEAELLQLPVPDGPDADELYTEQLPPGRLPHDRAIRKIENVSETVTMLATAFLNLAADSELLKDEGVDHKVLDEQEIPDLYSEEKLRALEIRFHNLQSL